MRFLLLLPLLLLCVRAHAVTLNVQDNYQFVYTVANSTGSYVSGQTVSLKIKKASTGYWYDFSDSTFKASGWTNKTTNLTEDSTNEYYYYTFNPPASETAAEQYLFVIDNVSATYGDHQTETVSYQNIIDDPDTISAAVWDIGTSTHNVTGTMGSKLNAAASAGDPWSTDISTTAYPGASSAGRKMHETWRERLRR
jgi:hypothetical protein